MNKTYTPTIGLEVHAELNTESKMFCGCSNEPHEVHPNTNICPVCMAHPGTLPVINEHAVFQVLRVGKAIGGVLADFTEFDRKNYFYPDIPKNYQISQYKYPLVSGGRIGSVDITRIHLEEDTARSSHSTDASNVDFNRAGVPLMELVTEPVIHDAQTAVAFARDLRLLLRYLKASHANLEKGEMRIEANISVSAEESTLGTKVEVKNLNSFKAVEQAIHYEIKRHVELLERGETIVQETRGWDENKQKTFSQRLKEDSHDYRYFPDPDLPKLQLSEISQYTSAEIESTLPELPWQKRERYLELGLKEGIAEVLVSDIGLGAIFEEAAAALSTTDETIMVANYLTSDIQGQMSKSGYAGRDIQELDGKELASIISMLTAGSISSRGAKDVIAIWLTEGGAPEQLAKAHGLLQISDTSELETIIKNIVEENASVVQEYKQGKEAALQFLIGQGMKATRGAANPGTLRELLVNALSR